MTTTRKQRAKSEGTFLNCVKSKLLELSNDVLEIKSIVQTLQCLSYSSSAIYPFGADQYYSCDSEFVSTDVWEPLHSYLIGDDRQEHSIRCAEELQPAEIASVFSKHQLLQFRNIVDAREPSQALSNLYARDNGCHRCKQAVSECICTQTCQGDFRSIPSSAWESAVPQTYCAGCWEPLPFTCVCRSVKHLCRSCKYSSMVECRPVERQTLGLDNTSALPDSCDETPMAAEADGEDEKRVKAHDIHECIDSVIIKFWDSQWSETVPVETVEKIAKTFKDLTPHGSNTLYSESYATWLMQKLGTMLGNQCELQKKS